MKQQILKTKNTHGGVRKGAGRPLKANRKGLPHLARPLIEKTSAVHVSWQLKETLITLNISTKDFFELFRLAVMTAKKKGLKIIHYSIMENHLHLIVEAQSSEELSRSLQSFALSLSKLVKNRFNGSLANLWNDRYFMQLLLSQREIKTALQVVLKNPQTKLKKTTAFDKYSSILAMNSALRKNLFPDQSFDESESLLKRFEAIKKEILSPATSSLLKKVLGI